MATWQGRWPVYFFLFPSAFYLNMVHWMKNDDGPNNQLCWEKPNYYFFLEGAHSIEHCMVFFGSWLEATEPPRQFCSHKYPLAKFLVIANCFLGVGDVHVDGLAKRNVQSTHVIYHGPIVIAVSLNHAYMDKSIRLSSSLFSTGCDCSATLPSASCCCRFLSCVHLCCARLFFFWVILFV